MIDPVDNEQDDGDDGSGTGHLKAGWPGWFQFDPLQKMLPIWISKQVPAAVFKTKGKKDEEGEGAEGETSLDEEVKRKLDALENLALSLWYQTISNQMVVTEELQNPTCLKPSSLRFKQKACNMVRTHVKLVVEEAHIVSWMSILFCYLGYQYIQWQSELNCHINIFSDFRTTCNPWQLLCPRRPIPNGRGKLTRKRILVAFHGSVTVESYEVQTSRRINYRGDGWNLGIPMACNQS